MWQCVGIVSRGGSVLCMWQYVGIVSKRSSSWKNNRWVMMGVLCMYALGPHVSTCRSRLMYALPPLL